VRMRDVVAELRAFPANIAYLCHDFAPNSTCIRAAGPCPLQAQLQLHADRGCPPGRPSGTMQDHPPAASRISSITGVAPQAN
jgi:hypothetical protein